MKRAYRWDGTNEAEKAAGQEKTRDMHVLIVEDDTALGHFLGHGLKLDGHEVSVVGDGDAALAFAARVRPEVMILDLGLPEKDGMEVLAQVGERFKSTSVLVLTGRTEMEDRVKCLELGADDVVEKPFSFHELRARLKAMCRRRSRYEETVLHFGDLEMDRVERTVTQAGRAVELTATEFSLMESLLRRRGERVCSREDLLREVWHEPLGMGTNIVEVYINYLRKKLGHGAARGSGPGTIIRTVRGEGYVLHARSDVERSAGRAARWREAQVLERKAG
ncbi:MAG TPA: response regulator transcription factor [Acidobacteriaceae bacterium]|nr:response regulator transcription factor [Acidobacteriaceae bacterium]